MFMETLSMMVATVPIIAPIMFKSGFDPSGSACSL
jgi:C4-dicarboxylate transporter, DctM subunit